MTWLLCITITILFLSNNITNSNITRHDFYTSRSSSSPPITPSHHHYHHHHHHEQGAIPGHPAPISVSHAKALEVEVVKLGRLSLWSSPSSSSSLSSLQITTTIVWIIIISSWTDIRSSAGCPCCPWHRSFGGCRCCRQWVRGARVRRHPGKFYTTTTVLVDILNSSNIISIGTNFVCSVKMHAMRCQPTKFYWQIGILCNKALPLLKWGMSVWGYLKFLHF